MADNRYDLNAVLAAYPADCRPIGAAPEPIVGGFSGSKIWRLETARGPLCLRRWPAEHPKADHLRWIHGVLRGAVQRGFALLPLPLVDRAGQTFVERENHLWELSPWLGGEPPKIEPPHDAVLPDRVKAAGTALALFHRAVCSEPANLREVGSARGILARLFSTKLLRFELQLFNEDIDRCRNRWPELADRALLLLQYVAQVAPHMEQSLKNALRFDVLHWPCIRDIHRDHVLFVGSEVTGLIDFGAMQADSVACDVARLLGSMAGDNQALWQCGLSAYEAVRPLSTDDAPLVRAYDESGVLLSGINWIRWAFYQNRQFDDRAGVLRRFDEITCRLANLASRKSSQTV